MKTSLIAFSLILCIFSSCIRKSQYNTGIFRAADSYVAKSKLSSPARVLAQASKSLCAADALTEERLLKEIRELENDKVPEVKGYIKGLDLSKLSPGQAFYLEKNKSWIFPQGIDFSDCSDVKCIYAKIYPNSSGLEGYLHYLFYLKMGYVLSTSETIPSVDLVGNPIIYPFAGRFSTEELKNFYLLTKILNPRFQRLKTLNRIHRFPVKLYSQEFGSGVCGIAGGALSDGHVILMDKCLAVGETIFDDSFVPLVTHEISHRLDYDLGSKSRFSESKAWLDLSGWYISESVNPQTGKTERRWMTKSSSEAGLKLDRFYRDYSAKEPTEDFADHVGYYRVASEKVTAVAPRKAEWISKNIYGSRVFTQSGDLEYFTRFITEQSLAQLPEISDRCIQNRQAFSFDLNDSFKKKFWEYDADLVSCVLGGVDYYLPLSLQKLKESEVSACSLLSATNVEAIKVQVIENISELIKTNLLKDSQIEARIQLLAGLISGLKEDLDPREIFVYCQENDSPMECYKQKLNEGFDYVSSGYSQIAQQAETLKKNYLAQNSYSEVKTRIMAMFAQIYAGSELRFRKEAEKRWNQCFPGDSSPEARPEELLLSPFSGTTQFMRSGLLNCLNRSANSELMKILDKMGAKLGISIDNEATKKFIFEMYVGEFTSVLQNYVTEAARPEQKIISEIQAFVQETVTAKLQTDVRVWLKEDMDSESEIKASCLSEAHALAKLEVESYLKEKKLQLNFHTLDGLSWEEAICAKVVSSTSVTTQALKNGEVAIRSSFPELESLLLQNAVPVGETCKKRYPKTDKSSLKARGNCLILSSTWNSLVNSSLKEWLKSSSFENHPSARSLGASHLQSKKNLLQDSAIETMNK